MNFTKSWGRPSSVSVSMAFLCTRVPYALELSSDRIQRVRLFLLASSMAFFAILPLFVVWQCGWYACCSVDIILFRTRYWRS